MNFPKTAILSATLALALAGCASNAAKKEGAGKRAGGPGVGRYAETPGGGYGAEGPYGSSGAAGYSGPTPDDALGPLSKRIVYFIYDSSEVSPEYIPLINAHANYLASNPGRGVVLEGHADERGSPEYNIALGEQRAKAVAKLMKLQGVSDGQLQIISFGEEKPAVHGHDDSSWQLNRRVEISYPVR